MELNNKATILSAECVTGVTSAPELINSGLYFLATSIVLIDALKRLFS